MARPNVSVTVGGSKNDHQSIYKTFILRENIPLASQINTPDTKYVVKWNFDLNGEEAVIAENCILEFDGGSVTNGILTLKEDTIIIDPLHAVCTSDTRPTIVHKGFQIFDKTLSKPLWWNGTAWVDATGNEPSTT